MSGPKPQILAFPVDSGGEWLVAQQRRLGGQGDHPRHGQWGHGGREGLWSLRGTCRSRAEAERWIRDMHRLGGEYSPAWCRFEIFRRSEARLYASAAELDAAATTIFALVTPPLNRRALIEEILELPDVPQDELAREHGERFVHLPMGGQVGDEVEIDEDGVAVVVEEEEQSSDG